MTMVRGAAMLLIPAMTLVPLPAMAARSVTLASADVNCIAKHLQSYLDAPDDPIVVIPGRCPNAVASLDTGTIPATNGPQISETSKIVVLRKSELKCIVARYAQLAEAARRKPSLTWDLQRCPAA